MKRISSVLIGLLLASFANAADIKTATSQATLAVLPDCSISATDIDLGVYNYRTGAQGQGILRVKCNVAGADIVAGTNYANAFEGNDSNAVHVRRTLTSAGGNTLPYHVAFSVPPYESGISFSANFMGAGVTGIGTIGYYLHSALNNVSLPIAVVVDPGQWKPAGTYTDTIFYSLSYTP